MHGIIVIVLIIMMPIIYLSGRHNSNMCNLKGFWTSSDDFNGDAEISSFNFYIGDKKNDTYSGYLLMIGDDNGIIINEPVKFCLTNTPQNLISCDKTFKMVFIDKETKLIANELKLQYYTNSGKIVLCNSKKIYAVFFKNNVVTELEQINDVETKPIPNIPIPKLPIPNMSIPKLPIPKLKKKQP